jgi:hypothetical protein
MPSGLSCSAGGVSMALSRRRIRGNGWPCGVGRAEGRGDALE